MNSNNKSLHTRRTINQEPIESDSENGDELAQIYENDSPAALSIGEILQPSPTLFEKMGLTNYGRAPATPVGLLLEINEQEIADQNDFNKLVPNQRLETSQPTDSSHLILPPARISQPILDGRASQFLHSGATHNFKQPQPEYTTMQPSINVRAFLNQNPLEQLTDSPFAVRYGPPAVDFPPIPSRIYNRPELFPVETIRKTLPETTMSHAKLAQHNRMRRLSSKPNDYLLNSYNEKGHWISRDVPAKQKYLPTLKQPMKRRPRCMLDSEIEILKKCLPGYIPPETLPIVQNTCEKTIDYVSLPARNIREPVDPWEAEEKKLIEHEILESVCRTYEHQYNDKTEEAEQNNKKSC